MCGIAGLVGTAEEDLAPLAASFLRILEHRGPDDLGYLLLSHRGVRLGRGRPDSLPASTLLVHRRLSILDLSEAGWQPMGTPDGRHFLVFNGEIYNYLELRRELEVLGQSFHSHSDTEVLLRACVEWGPAALNRLVGMFAFALLDLHQRTLFLARDFFGVKPLYYTWVGGRFAFASEIKALLELPGVPRRADPGRLYDYLRFGRTDHGGATLFAGIRQLPAAHYLHVSLDRPTPAEPIRYWQVDLDDRLDVSLDEASRRLRELFLENVRLHLRSDVAVGAALSGGIDSSAIVNSMRAVEPGLDIHAFSYVADDPVLSEERWVDLVGHSAGARLHKVHSTPDELVADLDRLVHQQDEPFGSTSIYAQHRVFRRAREAGITVMLDGQGADEMLAGYRPYLAARLASLVKHNRWLEAWRFLRRAGRLPGTGGLVRLFLQTANLFVPPGLKGPLLRLLGREPVPSWLNARWFRSHGVSLLPPALSRQRDMLRDELRRSLVESNLPMLLRYEDRNSMAHSIESRVPFLTPPLVDFVYRLPEEHLIARDGTSKSVFRHAMRGIVPDAVLDRRDKIGFATPEKGWLTSLRPWVETTLDGPAARQVPALNLAGVRREWQAVLQGRKMFDFRVWRWVNLIRWAERFDVSFAA
jgi:asparagine synthase (glutamine-hydrolysing)